MRDHRAKRGNDGTFIGTKPCESARPALVLRIENYPEKGRAERATTSRRRTCATRTACARFGARWGDSPVVHTRARSAREGSWLQDRPGLAKSLSRYGSRRRPVEPRRSPALLGFDVHSHA